VSDATRTGKNVEVTIENETKSELRFHGRTEREIVDIAKSDPTAISYLYREHYGAIHRYVHRRIGNAHDTNDIVAEVFLSMVRYLPRFRWTGAPFRCWLLVLTTTQINRWIRKRRFSSLWRSVDSFEPQVTESVDASDERIEPMRKALLGLPLNIQTVLTLHYFEDLSVAAIAEMLNCRPGTVKSRLSRGRELLRQTLTKSEEKSNEQRPSRRVLNGFEV
jgi:RNA polymerase sigma-70 factor, ECF subfamily